MKSLVVMLCLAVIGTVTTKELYVCNEVCKSINNTKYIKLEKAYTLCGCNNNFNVSLPNKSVTKIFEESASEEREE